MSEKLATGLMLSIAAMWGSSFVASKYCINSGMLHYEIVFSRFFIGTILTGLVFHKQLRRPSREAVKTGVTLGFLTTVTFTLEMFGLSMTDATKASFLTATNIVMMPFLYGLFCRVKPSRYSVGAALLALTGVGFLSLTNGFGSISVGDVLMLLDAVTYCMNSICLVKMAGNASRIQISFFEFLVTMICSGILMLFQGTGGTYEPVAVTALLYLAVVPTVVCYIIKNIVIKYVNPVRYSMVCATESVFCAIFAAIILHERISLQMFFGIVLIFCGIMVEIIHPARSAQHQAPEETECLTEG